MKLLMVPIDVAETHALQPEGKGAWTFGRSVPTALCWHGRLFEVESVLEEWTARGQWWGKEDQRHYFLLLTSNGVLEVFKGTEGWMLSRIVD